MSSIKGYSFVNNALFPAPDPPSYSESSFPGELVWVPHESKNESIPCLLLQALNATHLVIYCHGNGCDVGEMHPELHAYVHRWGCHVMAVEYPGYGPCEGLPSELTLMENVRSAFHWVVEHLGVPTDKIILFGRSIGTGPVTKLAAQESRLRNRQIGGLVLQSPYLSIKTLAKSLVGFWARLMLDRFKNYKEIRNVLCPVIAIHGKSDTLIPFQHSIRLLEQCPSEHKRTVLPPSADHNMFHLENDVVRPCHDFFHEFLTGFGESSYAINLPSDVLQRAMRMPNKASRTCFQSPGFFSSVIRSTARSTSTVAEVTAGAFSMITDKTKPVDHTTDPQ